MPQMYGLEVGRAADIIVNKICRVRKGESVLITIDSVTDSLPAEETAKAAEAAGARVLVAWHSTPDGYGKIVDNSLPQPLAAAIPESDVWVEFNNQRLLYSTAWSRAMNNGKTRYLFLGGLGREQITRCISRIDMDLQADLQTR